MFTNVHRKYQDKIFISQNHFQVENSNLKLIIKVYQIVDVQVVLAKKFFYKMFTTTVYKYDNKFYKY